MKIRAFVFLSTVTILGFLISHSLLADNIEKLCGTWINTDYNYAKDLTCQKIVFNNDGTYSIYKYVPDTEYHYMYDYEIKDSWTDSEGNVWYKATAQGVIGASTHYYLWRVNNTGTTWERRDFVNEFPTEMDTSWNYTIYYRQE